MYATNKKTTKSYDCFNLHRVVQEDKKVKPSQMFEGYKPPKKNVKKPKGKGKGKVLSKRTN